MVYKYMLFGEISLPSDYFYDNFILKKAEVKVSLN